MQTLKFCEFFGDVLLPLQSRGTGVYCSCLFSLTQVHYSTHLAVTHILLKRQQEHQHREKSKQLTLFENILKDHNGNLSSPYAPSTQDT